MLARVTRAVARRSAVAAAANPLRLSQAARFSAEAPQDAKEELALSPKVQMVLDQILELNMVEIAELSTAIQVRCTTNHERGRRLVD